MRMIYYKANKNYENALADVLVSGAATAGIDLIVKSTEDYRGPDGDASLIFGITKREILWDHQLKGHPLLYLDKGYARDRIPFQDRSVPAWWRMCWNAVHPTDYLPLRAYNSDRWERLGMRLRERAQPGKHVGHIVILGSSGKYHLTMQIDEPTAWTERVVGTIRHHSPRPITYRPKPSWKWATPVAGTTFDHGMKTPIESALAGAHCTVTYGSIACVDSIVAGVPCIVLGNGVAKPICSGYLSTVEEPFWPERRKREQWAANLAYSNFSPAEIANGVAWKILREQMKYAV